MRIVVCLLMLAFVMPTAPAGAEELRRRITPAANSGDYIPPKPKKGYSYPDCFCTDSSGRRVEMGQTACLKVGSQEFTARCDMSLNNPAWRRVQEGCPTS